jgi:DNA repair protein RadC
MQKHFPFSGQPDDHSQDANQLQEAAALYLDPRNRLISHGPGALSELDTLALLLGERDHLLATKLLLDFGSLTALSRASLAQLSPLLSPEKAMRLVCSFRLDALCASTQAATDPLDSPESIYNLFAAELMQLDREVLAIALLNAKFRLLKKLQISVGTLMSLWLIHAKSSKLLSIIPLTLLSWSTTIPPAILSPPSLISASPVN